MEQAYNTIVRINDSVNGFAWGTFGLVLLLGTGILCTLVTRVFQVTHFRHWWKKTFGSMRKEARIINDSGAL